MASRKKSVNDVSGRSLCRPVEAQGGDLAELVEKIEYLSQQERIQNTPARNCTTAQQLEGTSPADPLDPFPGADEVLPSIITMMFVFLEGST